MPAGMLQEEKNKEEGCRKGLHYPVRLIANGRRNVILPVPRGPVLPHYAAGSKWTIAWRIAMIMLRNTVQSNILAHLLLSLYEGYFPGLRYNTGDE